MKLYLEIEDGWGCFFEDTENCTITLREDALKSNCVTLYPFEPSQHLNVLKLFRPQETFSLIPEVHVTSFRELGITDSEDLRKIEWTKVLDRKKMALRAKKIYHQVDEIWNSGAREYYEVFHRTESFLNSLREFTIIDNSIGRKVKMTYDRFSVPSGRLVEKTPWKISSWSDDDRKSKIRSSIEGNVIVSLDFTSMEPRIAALLSGNLSVRSGEIVDVYAWIFHECDVDIPFDRHKFKLAVIGTLYGASSKVTSRIIDVDTHVTSVMQQKIRELLGCEPLMEKIQTDLDRTGAVFSYLGRPCHPQKRNSGYLLNIFLQSTAADLSILGMMSLTNSNPELMPIAVVHDALFAECRQADVDAVSRIASVSVDIPKFGMCSLPVRCKFYHDGLGGVV